jgi:hypothetical protein
MEESRVKFLLVCLTTLLGMVVLWYTGERAEEVLPLVVFIRVAMLGDPVSTTDQEEQGQKKHPAPPKRKRRKARSSSSKDFFVSMFC